MVLINLFAGKEWRHTCRQWICGHREGESGTNGENSIYLSIYIYIYIIRCKLENWRCCCVA